MREIWEVVGDMDGCDVGDIEGVEDGIVDGSQDGDKVGFVDGWDDGCIVFGGNVPTLSSIISSFRERLTPVIVPPTIIPAAPKARTISASIEQRVLPIVHTVLSQHFVSV